MVEKKKSEKIIRLEKYQTLKEQGINPFVSSVPDFIEIQQARTKTENTTVAVAGRILSIRVHGKLAFIDIKDETEKIQFLIKSENQSYSLIKYLDHGDYLWAKGKLFTTKAGELTIEIYELKLLSKALLPVPDDWNELSNVERRYRQRALDFKVNSFAKETIIKRANIIKFIRDYLEKYGFIEVSTPILQPLTGGAAAKPFVTRYNILNANFYLRISKELYLKRLIVGGFERVYEIGPDFRNEGLSHMHNPEFTMCEFYWAYKNYYQLMDFTQKMVQEMVEKINGSQELTYQKERISFKNNFARRKFADLIKEETDIDVMEENTIERLQKAINSKHIVLEGENLNVWEALVDELYKKTVRPKIIQPTFVTDHPASLSPLAKRHEQNPNFSERFQLVMAGGFEIVNAYSEQNDPIEQEKVFKEQLKLRSEGWEEAQMYDDNYIEALKFGMPPTAGWGMGIDRLTMIFTDQYSIKEVIPFPTLKPLHKDLEPQDS